MAEIADLQTLDANNTGRFPDGMPIFGLNDAARALEGMLARWFRDISGVTITGGSAAAYTVTTSRSITSLDAGIVIVVRAHVANSGAATLALNGMAAKGLTRPNGADLVAGDILTNQMLFVVYNASQDKFNCIGIMA
jgi:hypothetical protein